MSSRRRLEIIATDGSDEENGHEEAEGLVERRLQGQSFEGSKAFRSNCKLALCVSTWITIFGLPMYSQIAHDAVFGQEGCSPMSIGHVLETTTTPTPSIDARLLQASNETAVVVEEPPKEMWCGILPMAYAGNWPNVVQMIVFTVYVNTGTTIMQAWQGSIGTFCAALNYWIMHIGLYLSLFEHSSWVVWLDTMLVLFLFLASGAEENTMKFGMSWHVYFMMVFLSEGPDEGNFQTGIPGVDYDSMVSCTLITVVLGCALSVLATVFPPPALTNFESVKGDTAAIASTIGAIWLEAIDYFCGKKATSRCYQISESISALNKTAAGVSGNLLKSWWENMDLCNFGKKRTLYAGFHNAIGKTSEIMSVVSDCILEEGFEDVHHVFCSGLRQEMQELAGSAAGLLQLCEAACQDGEIDDEELDNIRESIATVKAAQAKCTVKERELSRAEKMATNISKDLMSENIFIFALSAWARKITDFAEGIVRRYSDDDAVQTKCCEGLFIALYNGFFKTWSSPSPDKMLFVLRNFVPIGIAFIMGFYYEGGVFTKHNSNMAGTLTLIISHYPGSAVLNDLKRLLGVTAGKIIPILLIGFLQDVSCGTFRRLILMVLVNFSFSWLFNYIYYSSQNWSGLGCLAAAYGAAMLMAPCGSFVEDFTAKYQDLGQVVFAIVIQIFADVIIDGLAGSDPRDDAVKKLVEIKDDLTEALDSFFAQDLAAMQAALATVKTNIQVAQALSPETDPNNAFMHGSRATFKYDLYVSALAKLELIRLDLAVLAFSTQGWIPDPLPRDGNGTPGAAGEELDEDGDFSMSAYINGLRSVHGQDGLQDELTYSLDLVLGSVVAILEHSQEDNNFQSPEKTRAILNMSTSGILKEKDLYAEINATPFGQAANGVSQIAVLPRTKLTVAVRMLQKTRGHLADLEKLMLPYITL